MKIKHVQRSGSKSGTLESPNAWAQALHLLESDGLELPPEPERDEDGAIPSLPDDLTDFDDVQLMGLFVRITRWTEYIASRLSRAEIEERQFDMVLRGDEARVLRQNWSGAREDRIAIAKALVDEDVRVRKAREKLLVKTAYRKALNTLYEAQERKAQLVSREITRRTTMEPAQRRAHRMGGGR